MNLRKLVIGALALAACAMADTVTLKSGRTVMGTFLGGTSREIRMEVNGQVQTFVVSDVSRIEFSAPPAAAAPAPVPAPVTPVAEPRPVLRQGGSVAAAPQPAPLSGPVELPAGTNLVIRMIDGVDSDVNRVGQTFNASIDEPVTVGGGVVIPRGADVVVKLVDAKDAGTFTGRAEMSLNLVSVVVNGKPVDLNAQTVSRESDARGQQTAKTAAGGAVLGAVIGAIAGGGKGAAIGATTGGAAGAGAQMVLKGPRVRVPSETRLTFTLDTPVKL